MDKNQKIAIVTGASRGIGASIVKKLSNEGYQVVGVYEKNIEKAKEVEKENKNVEMIQADIGKEEDIINMIKFVTDKYGQIDVLINNAGINLWGPIENFELSDWNRMLDVNLTAKFLLSKYSIPLLKKSKGVIINISSRAGMDEYVFSDFVSYCVTNAGINNFTKALAKELSKDEIRVNAVIPTVTDTDRFKNAFTPSEQEEVKKAGKLGTPVEVADHVYNLIIDKTKTGEILIDERVFIETTA